MSVKNPIFKTETEKNWLKSVLRDGIVTVDFIKKDGSARTMKCTLSESKIPKESTPKGAGKTENTDVLAVFDVEANGWRSFRYDSLTQIRFDLQGK